jgi:DNA-binding PadR family transcriptional regulator
MPPLGELEQLVLLALIQLGDDAYGVTVYEEIEGRTGRRLTLGAVYNTLAGLERKGLISSYAGEPTPKRGGRRKRHYRVLAAGRKAVARSVESIRRLADGLHLPGRAGQ